MRRSRSITPCVCAFGALVACNAITGADSLQPGANESDIGLPGKGTSSSGSTASSGSSGDLESGGELRSRPDGGTTETPPTQTDAGFDAATSIPPTFVDLFDRADSPTIGNGWTEKGDQFSISNGAVLQMGSGNYVNLLLSRPDVARDVQTSMDVTFGQNFDSDPCLHVRMPPASDATNELIGYTFFTFRDFAAIDREEQGNDGAELASQRLSPQLEIGQTYHMIFRVTGTDPVKLEATVLKPDGTAAATLAATDASPKKIIGAGKIGFGSGRADAMRFDNFTRTDL
jgi:hypothetical protein